MAGKKIKRPHSPRRLTLPKAVAPRLRLPWGVPMLGSPAGFD